MEYKEATAVLRSSWFYLQFHVKRLIGLTYFVPDVKWWSDYYDQWKYVFNTA